MKQRIFIKKARSILSDNNGARYLPRQLSGSVLDAQRLALADAGEQRIFMRSERRKYADYTFMLLVDVSGSMCNERIECAAAAVHALNHALLEAGARVLVRYFHGKTGTISAATTADPERLFTFLDTEVRSMRAMCNHDGFAVDMAARELLKVSRSIANVLLVFSDGSPECGCDDDCGGGHHDARYTKGRTQSELLRSSIKRARAAGVLTLAVAIQTKRPVSYYGERNTVVVNELNTLYSSACGLLEQNIRRG